METEKESLVIAGYVIRTMILRSGRIAHHFSFPLLRAEEKKFNSTLTSEKEVIHWNRNVSSGGGVFLRFAWLTVAHHSGRRQEREERQSGIRIYLSPSHFLVPLRIPDPEERNRRFRTDPREK